jgi:hypothetical protein
VSVGFQAQIKGTVQTGLIDCVVFDIEGQKNNRQPRLKNRGFLIKGLC